MKRLLREPLLHFLLLGAALFVLLRGPSAPPEARRIVVTARDVEHLTSMFMRTWQRAPTATEIDELVEEHVRSEVFYREGLALGLDADDLVVRQRMRQKMEALAEDAALKNPPGEAELHAYYESHPDAFRAAPRLSLRQVFLDPVRRGGALQSDAAAMLQTLQRSQGVAPATLGDASLFAPEYSDLSVRDVARIFGETFAAAVDSIPLQRWSGPFRSHLGAHLVYVSDRRQAELPPFAEAREAVAREVGRRRREAAVQDLYRTLRRRYDVELPPPSPAPVARRDGS
jgi:hypothetical protein